MTKNQSLPVRLQEKDSSSEHDLILYEHHDNPPSGDQDLAFQTHALQMILFRYFLCANPISYWVVRNCVLTIFIFMQLLFSIYYFYKNILN